MLMNTPIGLSIFSNRALACFVNRKIALYGYSEQDGKVHG